MNKEEHLVQCLDDLDVPALFCECGVSIGLVTWNDRRWCNTCIAEQLDILERLRKSILTNRENIELVGGNWLNELLEILNEQR